MLWLMHSSADVSDIDEPSVAAVPTPARGSSATAAVVAHLEALLFSGSVEAGDTLPSESELSAAVGVSRLTVREAVRSLVARGLITISHGRRPVVAAPNAGPLHDFFSAAVRRDPRSLTELLDLRLAVETMAAELAARHATRADLDAVRAAVDSMRAAAEDEVAFNDADVRFHAAVAQASGNRMLSFLVEGMEGPLHHSFPQSLRGYRATGASTDELVARHALIEERIRARDAAGAAAATRRHLEATRTELRAALAANHRGVVGV